jgi:serine/threonine protein kinase
MQMMSARVWGSQAALRAVDASMESTAHAATNELAELATGPAWRPPAEFDDYKIVRPLGQGAMGDVYLAHDLVLDRPVAVKFVHTSTPGRASGSSSRPARPPASITRT